MTSKTVTVSLEQLKKWHRDLDACQKVIWLRGGFDPAYCTDAQDCLKEMDAVMAATEAPRQSEPVAWGAWRKSLNRFHYIECNVDYMQRTYGKDAEDMGIDFELVPLYRHAVPLSPDHSGGGAGMVLPERRSPKHYWDRFGKMTAIALVSSEEWNACLDKVKELNQ